MSMNHEEERAELSRNRMAEFHEVPDPKDKSLRKKHEIESFTTRGKYYQVLEYEDGDFQCACPDHFYRQRECKHIRRLKYPPLSCRLNEFLELKQENGEINVYVKGERFVQCKYLLILDPQEKPQQQEINSIDEAKA